MYFFVSSSFDDCFDFGSYYYYYYLFFMCFILNRAAVLFVMAGGCPECLQPGVMELMQHDEGHQAKRARTHVLHPPPCPPDRFCQVIGFQLCSEDIRWRREVTSASVTPTTTL